MLNNIKQQFSGWFGNTTNRYLMLILLLACINFSIAFTWGMPQVTSPEAASPWPVDTIAPVPPLTEAYNKFSRAGAEDVIYPLFHYVVLDVAYGPYVVLQYLTGGLKNPSGTFPYGVTDPASFFRDLTIIARMVSLFMALVIIITIFRITRDLFGERAGLFAALMTSCLAPLAYYAKTSNLDVPYLFWMTLSAFHMLQAIQHQRLRNYLFFAVFAALAVASKDQAYGFFVLMPPVMIYALARHRSGKTWPDFKTWLQATFSKPILLTGVTVLITFGLANNLFFGGWDGYFRHVDFAQAYYQQSIAAVYQDKYSIGHQFRLFLQTNSQLMGMFGILGFLLCLGGFFTTLHKRMGYALSLLAMPVAYYVFCIAIVGLVFPRYTLGIALLGIPFAAYFIDHTMGQSKRMRTIAVTVFILSIASQLFLTHHLNYTLLKDSRYPMAQWIKSNVPKQSSIEVYSQHRYLPQLGDRKQYQLVGNKINAIKYGVIADELSQQALQKRKPDYILVLKGIGITGDPDRVENKQVRIYFDNLLAGKYDYTIIKKITTPTLLSYRQLTAGILPTSILLKHK